MTVTQRQKDILKSRGLNFIDEIAKAADEGDIHLYILVAMLEKETATVRNIYGNDRGGALAGFKKAVNQGNFEVFMWLITEKGQTSNGVGPSAKSPTKAFFPDMVKRGMKPWEPADNIRYGGELIYGYYRSARNQGKSVSESLKYAGTKYNGAAAYGAAYLEVATRWRGWLGNEDYRPT